MAGREKDCRRVWSAGSSLLRGSKELATEFGLSGQVCCVGQRNCRRRVVCRVKFGKWVKRIVGGDWSVGAKRASGSRELSAGMVCRVKYGEWVKGIGDGVWSVGSSMASGSRELSAACGLSGQVWRVGQRNCRWRVVCRQDWRVSQEACRWVWSVGAKMLRGSKGLSLECGLSARKCCVGQRDCR